MKISALLRDSFTIWSRSFTLTYVFFMVLLVVSLLAPQFLYIPPDYRMSIFAFIILLIISAIMAGFHNMVSKICQRYYEPSLATQWGNRPALQAGFASFKDFLPGIGEFFLPIAIGHIIKAVFVGLLVFWLLPRLELAQPALNKMMAAVQSGITPEQLAKSLSPDHQNTIVHLGTGICEALLGYALFNFITMLWPVMVVQYGMNAFKAYWKSIQQCFRDPLTLITLSVALFALNAGSLLLMALPGFFLDVIGRIACILFQIFGNIALYVYAWKHIGAPVAEPDVQQPTGKTSAEH